MLGTPVNINSGVTYSGNGSLSISGGGTLNINFTTIAAASLVLTGGYAWVNDEDAKRA